MPPYVHSRKSLHEVTHDLAATAMGSQPADLIIRNGLLVNVNTARIQEGMDVAVRHGFIALVGDAEHIPVADHTKVIDAKGRYLVPGFIDSHMHVESSMVDLCSFTAGILPSGTTTICPDVHEIANVFGLRAVKLFHETAQGLPLKVLVAMPVCVPSIPGFEDAGAAITAEEVAKSYVEGWAQLQGEQMNFPGLIYGDPHVHAITAEGLKAGVILTGHYADQELNRGLNAFIASGINACHEAISAQAALRRAELGNYPQQRYGTAWLDMPNTIRAILENPDLDTRFFSMITDDVTPTTIINDGHVVRLVRKAIELGVPPVVAIQLVTINAAQLLEKARWIGTISPGRAADILIVSDLEKIIIDQVFCDGVLCSEKGNVVVDIPTYNYPEWALHSVHLDPLTKKDFAISAGGDPVKVRVMELVPEMVHTNERTIKMQPVQGELKADPEQDLAKVGIFYRHEAKDGVTGTRGLGFVKGAKLQKHTAYASTVSHDCHNLLVLGTDDAAMTLAANKVIETNGGIVVVVDNRVEAVMPLPLAGLMSLESVDVASEQLSKLEQALAKAGCPYDSFEMTLSLLGLIVLEELHLSNRGLVELKEGKPPRFVDLIVKE